MNTDEILKKQTTRTLKELNDFLKKIDEVIKDTHQFLSEVKTTNDTQELKAK